nr:warthog protein WRT-5 [Caenorhabditis elegans]
MCSMWLMASWLMAFVAGSTLADYCGDHKVPFGMEVHKNGNVNILCSRPSCHEKKYAECPERATSTTCSTNSSWVGGVTQHSDGSLRLMCCEYDLLPTYSTIQYEKLTIRTGEYFEGDKQMEGDVVTAFDLIGNIEQVKEPDGKYSYNLLIYRYHCGNIPDTPPAWYMKKQWPYWEK